MGITFAEDSNFSLPTEFTKMVENNKTNPTQFCVIDLEKSLQRDSGNVNWSPKESLFVQAFCYGKMYFTRTLEESKLPISKWYFNAIGLGQYSQSSKGNQEEVCKEGKNSCDFLTFADKIYTAIMGDIFKKKRSYVALWPYETTEERVEWLLNVGKGTNTKQKYKDLVNKYKKTISMIKKNNKTFEKMEKDLKILDLSKLEQAPTWRKEAFSWNTNGVSSNPAFLNVVFNEYEWYNAFLIYYRQILQNKLNNDKDNAEYIKEINLTYEYADLSQRALKQSLEELNTFANTYQIHIAWIAYQESLLDLRNNYLSKIVTPLYTMYDKFRNVQNAE